jgi:hypothetical protein
MIVEILRKKRASLKLVLQRGIAATKSRFFATLRSAQNDMSS